MSSMDNKASVFTGHLILYATIYLGSQQRKQMSALLFPSSRKQQPGKGLYGMQKWSSRNCISEFSFRGWFAAITITQILCVPSPDHRYCCNRPHYYTRAWYGGGFYLSFLDGHAGFWCPICGICNPFVTSITESRRVDDLLCCSYFYFGRSMGQWSFGFESHSAIKYLCGQNDNYEMPWCIRICGRCSFLPGWDADPVPQSNVFGTSNYHWLFRLYPCGYVDILDINGVFLMSMGVVLVLSSLCCISFVAC